MSFARPDLLPLTLIVPALVAAAIVLYARRRRRMALHFGEAQLLPRLGGADLLRFPLARLVLLCTASASLAFAAAGPRWGQRTTEGSALALNVVIAADISKSMLAEDLAPNRLERSRLFARRLLRELPGDRFGLVVFAGRAYILSPLTVDHSAIELYLDALDPNMVSQGGSSLAAAVTQATDLVRGSEGAGGDRAVILLSDGEALEEEGAVRDAADRAARAGIRFITVGVGTASGARIPDIDPATGMDVGFKRDENGEVVVSHMDEALLRLVAEQTGGAFVRLEDGAALSRVVDELHQMQRSVGDSSQRVQARERFALFAILALSLLVIDALVWGPLLRTPAEGTAPMVTVRRLPRRRRLQGAAVLALALASYAFGIGDVERGNRLYREGRYEDAVAAYERAIADGKASPQVLYNLGTALLALGRYADAEKRFQSALAGVEPELRQRTFYNLGNRFLGEARSGGDLQRQGQLLDGAIEAYRRSLRIAPGDVDAKWNLELAQREREQNRQRQQSMPDRSDQDQQQNDQDDDQQGQQQGQGSGANPSQSPSGEGDDAGSSSEQQPMARDQADRILSAIEQDERDLTREKLRRGQRRTPVLRDW